MEMPNCPHSFKSHYIDQGVLRCELCPGPAPEQELVERLRRLSPAELAAVQAAVDSVRPQPPAPVL